MQIVTSLYPDGYSCAAAFLRSALVMSALVQSMDIESSRPPDMRETLVRLR